MNFDVICMANSRKLGGRCVAGIRIDGGGWVRPVSSERQGVLNRCHYRLPDGSEPGLLDVIRIGFSNPNPQYYQPENWLISERQWQLAPKMNARLLIERLRQQVIRDPPLLGNMGDRVPVDSLSVSGAKSSLALVCPKDLRWLITTNINNNRQIRALFGVGGQYYDLGVTDDSFGRKLRKLDYGEYDFAHVPGLSHDDEILLTVSLGEPFHGYCYKLVAAIVVVPHNWRGAFKA